MQTRDLRVPGNLWTSSTLLSAADGGGITVAQRKARKAGVGTMGALVVLLVFGAIVGIALLFMDFINRG